MRKRISSFRFAIHGIRDFIASGRNAQIQCYAALAVIVFGVILSFSLFEWIAAILCIGSVLSLEAMNTALEALADEVSLEKREGIRKAKDMAAGAVLISALASLAVFVFIVYRHFSS